MANNSTIGSMTISDIDFQSLKISLQRFMSQQSAFQDWNFEGSAVSTLLDLLAYNTHLNALYTNMAVSESFLDSAQLRSSIVSHAKELDYIPRSRTSAMALINIQAVGANLPQAITVPANFQIIGKDTAGDIFYFITDEPLVLTSASNWQANNVTFYEGRYISETFIANTGVRYYTQSSNVDTTSIVVSVTNSTTDSNTSVWSYASDINGIDANSNVWFMQGYDEYQYEVVFGDGIVGASLKPGNIVTIGYRETSGNTGNAFLTYTPFSGIAGANVSIMPVSASTSSYGGNDAESNTDIKFNGPRYYQTQGRAISTSDYVSLIRSQFPQIVAATAYGGEDAVPQRQYGSVIISAKIAAANVLPDSLKSQILNYMRDKVPLSISLIVNDPDVFNLIVDSTVIYSLTALVGAPSGLSTSVASAINSFDATNLEDFNHPLYMSQLASSINASDPSIISNNTKLTLYKQLAPTSNTAPVTIYFNNPIDYDSNTPFLYPTGYEPAVWSSEFKVKSGDGSLQDVVLRDNGLGVLVVALAANTDSIIMRNAGSVDYTNGVVSMPSVQYSSLPSDGIVNVYVKTLMTDKIMTNSQILSIMPSDVSVNLVQVQ